MLTNEIVLKVFSDYLNRDTDLKLSRPAEATRSWALMTTTVRTGTPWTIALHPKRCGTLLNAYESFRIELEITGGGCDRDLTEKEEAKLAKERDALTELCEKEAAKCSS